MKNLAIFLAMLLFGFSTSGKSCVIRNPFQPIGPLSNEEGSPRGRPLCSEAYPITISINNRPMR
jgi:hypothetical protein